MQKQRLQQKSKGDERSAEWGAKSKRRKVVPGIELGLPESESDVLTITLYNHFILANLTLRYLIHDFNALRTDLTSKHATQIMLQIQMALRLEFPS
jgi:hypothetical protein